MKKIVLITGASSGIGKETAKKLISDGHTVFAAARRVEKMKDLENLGATIIKIDILKEEDLQNLVHQIIDKHGKIDVLVNNAGYAIYGAIEDTSIEDAKRQFDVNLFGLARLTQLVLPHMRKQKSGTIINMSSMGGKMYTPLGAWYHATKHALEGWSDCLRLELKSFNIDVVIIEPGGIATEFGEVMKDPMMERSGNSAYSALAKRMKKGTENTFENGKASPPSVIAKDISKAIEAKRPKTRYRSGFMAKPAVFFRTYFGDRFWDWMIMKAA